MHLTPDHFKLSAVNQSNKGEVSCGWGGGLSYYISELHLKELK
jgi:hypothetical protein